MSLGTGALVRAYDSSQSIRPGTQAEALARAVAESMPGGVLVVDAAGVIVLANRQIESQFGYSCAELVGQSIDILLPESSRAAHAAHRASLMATRTPARWEPAASCSADAETALSFRSKLD